MQKKKESGNKGDSKCVSLEKGGIRKVGKQMQQNEEYKDAIDGMNSDVANAIIERIEFIDFVIKRIEPITDPARSGKKEVAKGIMADIEMFVDVGNIIKLQLITEGGIVA
jgi:hypothetical protein